MGITEARNRSDAPGSMALSAAMPRADIARLIDLNCATALDEGQSEPGHRNLTDLDAVDASLLYKERVLRGPEDEGSDK